VRPNAEAVNRRKSTCGRWLLHSRPIFWLSPSQLAAFFQRRCESAALPRRSSRCAAPLENTGSNDWQCSGMGATFQQVFFGRCELFLRKRSSIYLVAFWSPEFRPPKFHGKLELRERRLFWGRSMPTSRPTISGLVRRAQIATGPCVSSDSDLRQSQRALESVAEIDCFGTPQGVLRIELA
jgi:hypothetical protein